MEIEVMCSRKKILRWVQGEWLLLLLYIGKRRIGFVVIRLLVIYIFTGQYNSSLHWEVEEITLEASPPHIVLLLNLTCLTRQTGCSLKTGCLSGFSFLYILAQCFTHSRSKKYCIMQHFSTLYSINICGILSKYTDTMKLTDKELIYL